MPSPMVTACVQAATISSASNVLAQITNSYYRKIPFRFDVQEFLRFVILAFLTTPPNFKWQLFLERQFPAYDFQTNVPLPLTRRDVKEGDGDDEIEPAPKRKLNIKNTLIKWFIDCMTIGALLNTVAWIVLVSLLKGQSRQQVANNVKTETFHLIVNSYKLWPVASIISFAFIPVEKRIVFLSAVGLVWGVYMSLIAASI